MEKKKKKKNVRQQHCQFICFVIFEYHSMGNFYHLIGSRRVTARFRGVTKCDCRALVMRRHYHAMSLPIRFGKI